MLFLTLLTIFCAIVTLTICKHICIVTFDKDSVFIGSNTVIINLAQRALKVQDDFMLALV